MPEGIIISSLDEGTPDGDQLPAVNQFVLEPPTQVLHVSKVTLEFNEYVHDKDAVKAIAVTVILFEAPAELNDDVEKVPVPEAKVIVAVVELTVLVPLIL